MDYLRADFHNFFNAEIYEIYTSFLRNVGPFYEKTTNCSEEYFVKLLL